MNRLTFKVQLTPTQSECFQKKVLAKGGAWEAGEKTVLYLDNPFMVLNRGKMSTAGEYDERYFQNFLAPEIMAGQAFSLVEKALPVEKPSRGGADELTDREEFHSGLATLIKNLDEMREAILEKKVQRKKRKVNKKMKNILVKVQVTPEQSERIQRALAEKGGCCVDRNANVNYTDMPFMLIDKGLWTFYHTEARFNDENIRQVFARGALELIKASTSLRPAYVIDDRGDRLAIRKRIISGTNTNVVPAVLDRDTPGLMYLWEFGKTTRYSKQSDITTHYGNEHRDDMLRKACILCDELNNQKGEDE